MNINMNMKTPDIISRDYRDIVILYCPEKVGSTSIVTSIRISASNKYMVFHSHDNKIADLLNDKVNSINISDLLLNNSVVNPLTGQCRKIYIIDIFRTQLERKMSFFFQHISDIHFNNSEQNISAYPLDKIVKRFNDVFVHMSNVDYYNEKYDVEHKINTFDFENKYVLQEKNNVFYIKLRLHDAEHWGSILTNLLNTPIYLIKYYETMDKNIGKLYTYFKQEYVLPNNFYNLITNDKSLNIYMKPTEKQQYLEHWSAKVHPSSHCPFTFSEYMFYINISNENKFYCSNSANNHYGDDGCLCDKCVNERKQAIWNIKNQVSQTIYIRHPYDEKYNNFIYLKLFSSDVNNPVETVINLINF